MSKEITEISVKALIPTANGCAMFLSCPQKTYVIYIDQGIGQQISMIQEKVPKERPMTHDLFAHLIQGLGATLERVVIYHTDNGTFFARMIVKMENELGIKLLELDARPSDSIAIALQAGAPIFTTQSVLDAVVDMGEILEKLLKEKE
jgi:bifunctional DNase/RNase